MNWNDYLKQIKERIEKATKGPWYFLEEDYGDSICNKPNPEELKAGEYVDIIYSGSWDSEIRIRTHDGEFISKSRTDIKKLVARVEELTEALSIFNFNEELPKIGKSYWIDEHDLRMVKEVLSKEVANA